MAKLITMYWRDIPAQVIAKHGRETAKIPLTDRFQVAIDRAAMRAGKGGSQAYIDDWRREARECGSDLRSAAESAARELEAAWSDELLDRTARAKGLRPDEG
jgi:hypothetical protein